jgi:hypothetical protein
MDLGGFHNSAAHFLLGWANKGEGEGSVAANVAFWQRLLSLLTAAAVTAVSPSHSHRSCVKPPRCRSPASVIPE